MIITRRNWSHLQNYTYSKIEKYRVLRIRRCRLTDLGRVYVFVLEMSRWGEGRHRKRKMCVICALKAPHSKFIWVSGGEREARLGCLWATSPHPPVDWMLPGWLDLPQSFVSSPSAMNHTHSSPGVSQHSSVCLGLTFIRLPMEKKHKERYGSISSDMWKVVGR